MENRDRIGILISGTGSNMRAIAEACRRGDIEAGVTFVGADRPDAAGLEWARRWGIDTFVVDYRALDRASAEAELLREIEARGFDLLCLAGFMRLLSRQAIDRLSPSDWDPRIINVHPSLLPAFPGTDGYGDTVRYGCRIGGCTVHFVDSGEDTGPIIGQRCFRIESHDDLNRVRSKGLTLEHELYPECVRLYFEGRLLIDEVRQRGGTRRYVVEILQF